MKYLVLLLSVVLLTSEKCNKKKKSEPAKETAEVVVIADEKDGVPACVQKKIDSIKKEPRWNPPAEVNEYRYNDKKVFLFSSDCCDFFNLLLDSSCNYICAPSGGITGKGDMQCSDFDKVSRHIKLVWKDNRK